MITYVLIFIFGLLVGSFLNVIIHRLHTGESFLFTRSQCPRCGHVLAWYELVPVISFFAQKRRCRKCRQPISWQYPTVELATALLFVASYAFVVQHMNDMVIAWWGGLAAFNLLYTLKLFVFVSVLLVVFVYDLRHYLILDVVTVPAMIFAFAINVILFPRLGTVTSLLGAAAVSGGFFWLQYVVSKGRWIGGGDIRLGALMGFMLGWPYVVVALFVAYILGALVSIALLIAGRKRWESQVPFGTFLAIGTVVALFFAEKIITWYLSYV